MQPAEEAPWAVVAEGIDEEDREFVTDYIGDLTLTDPADLRWVRGMFPVPPLVDGQEDTSRRPTGHVESLRAAVAAGTAPPVLVVDGAVVDGWHRIKAAARNGQGTVPAWFGATRCC